MVIIGIAVVEGVVLDVVLALAVSGTAWPWVVAALHGWAVVEILGLYAALATRPHLLDADGLLLRDGHGVQVRVPAAAIVAARRIDEPVPGRTGWAVEGGKAVFAQGRATVALRLDPRHPVVVDGTPGTAAITSLRFTATDPERLVAALEQARAGG